jgi:hypothetical protein
MRIFRNLRPANRPHIPTIAIFHRLLVVQLQRRGILEMNEAKNTEPSRRLPPIENNLHLSFRKTNRPKQPLRRSIAIISPNFSTFLRVNRD